MREAYEPGQHTCVTHPASAFVAHITLGSTVRKAVDASRPEVGTEIRDSRQAVKDVSESQDDYCDTGASADVVLGEFVPDSPAHC